VTPSTLTPDAVDPAASYEIWYSAHSHRELHGYTLIKLYTEHRLPGGLEITAVGGGRR
jgi:hypothetical protein